MFIGYSKPHKFYIYSFNIYIEDGKVGKWESGKVGKWESGKVI